MSPEFSFRILENLGKSFLKYGNSIHSFKTYENYHEGLLNIKKNKIISNVALFKLGCARKILRFIRNEPFYLKVPNSTRSGNVAALSFIKWIKMDIDFIDARILRHFIVNSKKLVNVWYLEITATLQVSRPFAHLKFLGDVMLYYVVTAYLYYKFLRLITYLWSNFLNNECYTQSAVKASLHEHILHASPDLHRQICFTVENFEKLDILSMSG
uniref:RNase III domain-containing protein n=1 Tax=Solanum lycopersicum TaxID=4081 RepID=K4AU29_SOLLC